MVLRSFQNIREAVAAINAGERPLALYYFGSDEAEQNWVLDNTLSGGVSINDVVMHPALEDAPFGGVGASGMGHYHGREGFENFSKLRPVFYQARFSSLKFLMPPYGRFADFMLRFLTK